MTTFAVTWPFKAVHPLTELFIPTPSRLRYEQFSLAAITALNAFVQICSRLSVAKYSTDWTKAMWG